ADLGTNPEFVADLLAGRAHIKPELAAKLHALLGASPDFWLSRERRYREGLVRIGTESLEVKSAWLRALPVKDMVRFGWIASGEPAKRLDTCLRFFDVSSVTEWKKRYENEISAS